ncbi:MAG: fibronectin type III domain-containing protein [Spirochaetaceae bacterium]|nr:fibronectin type III domain-containing protein [Spirochaetaceae bacterium]
MKALSADTVKLSWGPQDGNEDVDYYWIKYGKENDINEAEGGESSYETEATISYLDSASTYYFWVQAVGYSQRSEFSSSKSCKTWMETPSIWVTKKTTTSVTLGFSLVDGATRYGIYCGFSNDFSESNHLASYRVKETDDYSVEIEVTGLNKGKKYYFFVSPFDEGTGRSTPAVCSISM